MSKKHHKTSWQGLHSSLLSPFLFIWLLRWINEHVAQVLQKSQQNYSKLLMLPQGYCKIFMALAHADCEVQKWKATHGIRGINVKPYQKVSNNRFQIFLSFVFVWLRHLATFITRGVIIYLLKISQQIPIYTRDIYNFCTRHPKIMINLPEPIHNMINNLLNFHGDRTYRYQDIIIFFLSRNKIISNYFCKNMACFIFLLKTRLTPECDKIWITPFGPV